MPEEPKTIVLSKKNARRYDKMAEDIESGKAKTICFKTTKEIMDYLNNH